MTRFRILAVWLAVSSCAVCFGAQQVNAQDPRIYLDVEEATARPGNLVPVSIFMQNLGDSIRAFQLGLTLNRPDLMAFNTYTSIQTCYECGDSACTTVVAYPCTVQVVPATAEGTLTASWEYVEARTSSSFDMQVTGIADVNLDDFPGPITPYTNGILIKVLAEVFCDVEDSLTDRTVVATISAVETYFSNSQGDLIRPLDFTEGAVTIALTERGDMNGDRWLDAVDIAALVDYLYAGADAPCPSYVADMTCEGFPDAEDLAYLIDHVFAGGPPAFCE